MRSAPFYVDLTSAAREQKQPAEDESRAHRLPSLRADDAAETEVAGKRRRVRGAAAQALCEGEEEGEGKGLSGGKGAAASKRQRQRK